MDKTESVTTLQRNIRKWLAKTKLEKLRQARSLDLALKQAYVEMVRRQRVIEDRRNKRLEEERRKKLEFNRYKKKVLEAAYDGDVPALQAIFQEIQNKEVLDEESANENDKPGGSKRVPDKFRKLASSRRVRALVDCTDPNGNTPLSEAATGGSVECIRYLIGLEADPNCKGQFGRTPLWRASFCGHVEAVEALLENGADPRIYADDGQTPEQVSPNDTIKLVFESWNIDQTKNMLTAINRIKEKHKKEIEELKKARCDQLDDLIAAAEKEVQLRSQKTCTCQEGFNRRLKFLDTVNPANDMQFQLAKTALNDAELELESSKIELDKARGSLAALRLRRREIFNADQAQEQAVKKNEMKVNLRELDEVLIRDVGNKLARSDKWPLVIDPSAQSATFLRYRDTNYLHALHPNEMKPESIRMALLGAVRYGKPFVLDLLDYDSLFDTSVRIRFDDIMKDCLDLLVAKNSFLNDEVYLDLIKKSDGPEYDRTAFNEARMAGFQFIVVTSNSMPNESLINRFLPIRVITEFSSFLDPSACDNENSANWI